MEGFRISDVFCGPKIASQKSAGVARERVYIFQELDGLKINACVLGKGLTTVLPVASPRNLGIYRIQLMRKPDLILEARASTGLGHEGARSVEPVARALPQEAAVYSGGARDSGYTNRESLSLRPYRSAWAEDSSSVTGSDF